VPLQTLARDRNGGVLVEATVLIPIVFVFVLGSIDFLFAFFQWNMANKAVQLGARRAAVSDPVSSDLPTMTGLVNDVLPGQPMPAFTRTCSTSDPTGATGTCTGARYSPAAMQRIVFGQRGAIACSNTSAGMCNLYAPITAANVKITYAQTGLGYAGRPGGPVPTITVSLRNLPFRFFFLSGLVGFGNINMPAMTTTITGESLSSDEP
jgi:Flp pilus assembly protein TadG